MSTSAPTLRNGVVFVVGATGTGKSDLAISLAQQFNGEIVNGDAMQLYQGLDTITNKTPVQERYGVPHHLLGTVGWNEEPWTMPRYRKKALATIEEIHARQKLPIVVGGTGYYVNSLLSPISLTEDPPRDEKVENVDEAQQTEWEKQYPLFQEPTETILLELERVDPVMARRWHPKDRRKIMRSLAIFLQTGRPASEIYAAQKVDSDGVRNAAMVDQRQNTELVRLGDAKVPHSQRPNDSPLFPSLILWPTAPISSLETRLNERIEKMIQQGLLSEVDELREHLRRSEQEGKKQDITKGIWVAIGFKEFLACSERKAQRLSSGDVDAESEQAYEEAVIATRAATRQYAVRQLRWLRRKLVPLTHQLGLADQIFPLDVSDKQSWKAEVEEPAIELVNKFLSCQILPRSTEVYGDAVNILQLGSEAANEDGLAPVREHCELCNVTAVLLKDWRAHLGSRSHKRRKKAEAEGSRRDQWIRKQARARATAQSEVEVGTSGLIRQPFGEDEWQR